MPRSIISLILSFLFGIGSMQAQQNLQAHSLLSGKLILGLAGDFVKVVPIAKAEKDSVDAGFTSKLRSAALKIFYSNSKMADNDIPAYTDELLAKLKAKEKNFQLIEDGIILNNGSNIGYLAFSRQQAGRKLFSAYLYLSLEGRLLLIEYNSKFNNPAAQQELVQKIGESLRLQLP